MLEDEILGAKIVKLELPTVFVKSREILEKALEKERPDIVICVGQAGGSAAYFSTLPIKGGFIHIPYIPEQVIDKKWHLVCH